MAISLGQFKQAGQQMATSESLAAEYARQQKKASKRKGWKGLIGKVAGTGLGAALTGFLGVASGGLLAPLLMAAGQFGGKKLGHELTRGMAAKTSGLQGDKYGYGKGEAKTLAEGLRAQMATDPMKEKGGFGQDVLGSYLSAGLSGELGGVGKAFKKDGGGFKQALGVGKDYGTGTKGLEGAIAGVSSLFDKPWGGEEDKGLIGTQDPVGGAVDPSTIGLEKSLEGSGLDLGQYQAMVDKAQEGYEDTDDFWDLGSIAEIPRSSTAASSQYDYNPQFEEGGRVADDVSLAIGGKSILDLFQTDSGEYGAEQAFEIMRPEGKRWYLGKGEGKAMGRAKEKAMLDAMDKAQFNPADSLVTGGLPINEVLAALGGSGDMEEAPKKKKKFGFFEEGGQVPQYYGGGSVSPTISEYFNKQGKSLGGSNKQSLAEILGRK